MKSIIVATVAISIVSCDRAPTNDDSASASPESGATLEPETSSRGNAGPCDDIDGTVPAACSEWLSSQCAALPNDECAYYGVLTTAAGELGCAVAEPLVPGNSCAADPPICVAALHTGEGPQGPLWFSDENVYRVECDGTALPCPALIVLGWSACGIEAGAPGTCDCT